MNKQLMAILACLAALAVSVTAPLLLKKEVISNRVHQHVSAQLRPEDEVDDGTFNSHLPLLIIDTEGVEIPGTPIRTSYGEPKVDENGNFTYTVAADGSKEISASLKVVDHADRVNRPEDTPELETEMTIRVRGNSSRFHDKPNYLLNLVGYNGKNNPLPLLGMDAHHEWALHGPFLDKTLIRNYMWYNISGEIMDYAPNVRFCEVMLNGEYRGVYLLTEMITAGKNGARLNLTVDKKNNTFSGYLLRLDRGSDLPVRNVDTFSTYTGALKVPLEIKYPGSEKLTEEMAEAIRQDFSEFEKALYSFDFEDENLGYKKYIDVDSFVDYFLINEFSCNYDAGGLSTYIYKDLDGLYRMCVWDFNSACDNYREQAVNTETLQLQKRIWTKMLACDEDFTERIVKRYWQHRSTVLSEEYLDRYVDEVVAYLGPAIDRNFQIWGYTFEEEADQLIPTERNFRSYEDAVAQLKTFLKDRGAWLDENIDSILQYSNEAKINEYCKDAN